MRTIFSVFIFSIFMTVGFVLPVTAGGPVANTDAFVLDVTSEVISLNVLLNDDLRGQSDVTLDIIYGPEFGTVEVDAENNSVIFYFEGEYDGDISFEYEVCGTSNACGRLCDRASVEVKIIRFPVIPEGFTPNGDNVNDGFILGGIRGFERFEITIVNRWGALVYESKDYDNNDPWRGTFGKTGEKLPQGAYYYFLKIFKNNRQIGDPVTGVVHIFK